jgi:hypothetical protein
MARKSALLKLKASQDEAWLAPYSQYKLSLLKWENHKS